MVETCNSILTRHHNHPSKLVDYCVALSRLGNQNAHDPMWSPEREVWVRRQADFMRDMMKRHNVGFWTHMYGNAIEYAHDQKLELLGPNTIISHCTDISQRSIDILRETGTKVAHHPRAARIYTYPGRCPVPELIEAGVTVGLGADGPPPNRNCDIFLDMKAAMRLQRVHFKDPDVMPAGKLLEMATIDGYKALGLDDELGSIEVGKKADIITVDLFQPHLYPINMPVHRVVYEATGQDVRDVIVDGRLVMEGRKVLTIDEEQVLDSSVEMNRMMIERARARAVRDNSRTLLGSGTLMSSQSQAASSLRCITCHKDYDAVTPRRFIRGLPAFEEWCVCQECVDLCQKRIPAPER